jgi:hypothetical protein
MNSLSDNKLFISAKKMTEPFENIFVPSKVYVTILQLLENLFQTKKKFFVSSLVLVLNMKLPLAPC